MKQWCPDEIDLFFRQYVPGKSHKYGVKICKAADTNGFTWNSETIAMQLLEDLLGCYQTIVANDFFTSINLARRLLGNDTYLIGTWRSDCVRSGKATAQRKIQRGEIYGLQSDDGVKLIKWKDKREVLMISTKPSHTTALVNIRKTTSSDEHIIKP